MGTAGEKMAESSMVPEVTGAEGAPSTELTEKPQHNFSELARAFSVMDTIA